MKKIVRVIPLVLAALLLLTAVALAEPQAKSWDKQRENLYAMFLTRDGEFTVVADGENNLFGWYFIADAAEVHPEEMRGAWTLTRVSGDDIEAVLHPEDAPCGNLELTKGTAGQSAAYDLTYTSDELINPISKRVTITLIAPDDKRPTGYRYAKTKHSYKTGERFDIAGGTALPKGIEKDFTITFYWESSIQDGEGWLNVEADGSLHGAINKAGTYKAKVTVELVDNLTTEIVHTFTITGPDAIDELPVFGLGEHSYTVNKMVNPDETSSFLAEGYLWDTYGRDTDEFVWTLKQTAGKKVATRLEIPEPWVAQVYAEQALAAGTYKFKLTVTDKTRGESDSAEIVVNVKNPGGEKLPDGIYYDALNARVTLGVGKTLTLGNPKFTPAGAKAPTTRRFYISIESEASDEVRAAMIQEDAENGRHKITGVQAGVYTIALGIDMYNGSRDAMMTFELVVKEGAGTAVESVTISTRGDWDDPYRLSLGDTLKLAAKVAPKNAKNKKITWVSGNPREIQVSAKGVVTGLVEGAWAEIYAYAADGKGAFDRIVVQISAAQATKITLNKKKLACKIGQRYTLNVKFAPAKLPDSAKRLIWVSDNSEIVEVDRDSGEILAKARGKATIHVYAVDGEGRQNKKVSAACAVTVK